MQCSNVEKVYISNLHPYHFVLRNLRLFFLVHDESSCFDVGQILQPGYKLGYKLGYKRVLFKNISNKYAAGIQTCAFQKHGMAPFYKRAHHEMH